jgi:hypothetical protein
MSTKQNKDSKEESSENIKNEVRKEVISVDVKNKIRYVKYKQLDKQGKEEVVYMTEIIVN